MGKALLVHIVQTLEDLVGDLLDVPFAHGWVLFHVLLQVSEREVLHGDEEVVVVVVPPYEFHEAP